MSKKSGQHKPAEEKDGVQNTDVISASEPETEEKLTQEAQPEETAPEAATEEQPEEAVTDEATEEQPEETASEAATEEQPEEAAPEAKPKKAPSKASATKKAPSKKAPPKKASSRKAPPKKAPPRKPPPKSTGRLLVGLLVKIAVIAGLGWALFTFVIGFSVHYGNNMYPAIHDGDLLISFRLQKPFLNSVVLYRLNGKTEVGRVIALEGSVVDISETGMLTINGVAPTAEIFYATYQAENSPISFPYTVESGKVFILNDFRDDTNDSRLFGAVDREDLQGPMLITLRRRSF